MQLTEKRARCKVYVSKYINITCLLKNSGWLVIILLKLPSEEQLKGELINQISG